MILYCPEASVTADRVRSISAGLLTSTVTPGSTAPDASLTVPAMVLVCADATIGQSVSHTTPTMIREANVRIPSLRRKGCRPSPAPRVCCVLLSPPCLPPLAALPTPPPPPASADRHLPTGRSGSGAYHSAISVTTGYIWMPSL